MGEGTPSMIKWVMKRDWDLANGSDSLKRDQEAITESASFGKQNLKFTAYTRKIGEVELAWVYDRRYVCLWMAEPKTELLKSFRTCKATSESQMEVIDFQGFDLHHLIFILLYSDCDCALIICSWNWSM